jgi:hypothetical protein
MSLSVAGTGSVVRETKRVFPYQPGKSLLILNTFSMNTPVEDLKQRVGYFGTQNGIFLETDDEEIVLEEDENGKIDISISLDYEDYIKEYINKQKFNSEEFRSGLIEEYDKIVDVYKEEFKYYCLSEYLSKIFKEKLPKSEIIPSLLGVLPSFIAFGVAAIKKSVVKSLCNDILLIIDDWSKTLNGYGIFDIPTDGIILLLIISTFNFVPSLATPLLLESKSTSTGLVCNLVIPPVASDIISKTFPKKSEIFGAAFAVFAVD